MHLHTKETDCAAPALCSSAQLSEESVEPGVGTKFGEDQAEWSKTGRSW